jgi:uncharacterized protein involved in exopolysaccharide biosynthesis
MKLTEHLDRIFQLVLDRADPAKVRGHIELIRDQVDAVAKIEAQLRKQIARDKKSHAKEMAKITQDYAAYKDIVETYGMTPKQFLKEVRTALDAEMKRRGMKHE